jgi:flagellar hook-associated protein 3 FlgL
MSVRISTSTIFQSGSARISELQAGVNKTQQQVASGRRISTPADDPSGSARALVISQADAVNDQFAVNRNSAKNTLSLSESVLGDITTLYQNAKAQIIYAGNGTLNDADRGFIADDLQGNLDQILSLANSKDGVDNYLFSGFNSTTQPYTKTQGGASYGGDQGQRYLQVDTSRQLPLSQPGPAIFENIRTSAGQFNVQPNPSNVGGGTVTASINAAASNQLTGNNYEVNFDATGLNFTVTNKTTGSVVVPSTVYSSPQTITFDGIDLSLSTPATVPPALPQPPAPGDHFSIQPGSQNIFETLTDIINVLRTPANSAQAKVDLTAALTQANNNVDKGLGNVLTARTQLGTSLKEIDSLNDAGLGTGIIFKQELADLTGLDYAKAITELNQQNTTLQAAQQSFAKISGLSLFNYIN